MHAPHPDHSGAGFVGELSVAADGMADGWCADPARPGLRCWVEILAEDRLAATVLAREERPDHGAHGFVARLPPASLPDRPEVLVWARVKGARRGFAQRLLSRPGVAVPVASREAALAEAIGGLSADLACISRRGAAAPASAWRDDMRGLATALGRRAGRRPSCPDLPFVRRPAISLVVPAGLDLSALLLRLDCLAPVARELAADMMVLGGAPDATALLPSLVPNLRIGAAAADARGERVALLGPDETAPSRATLAHVLRDGPDIVFGPSAPAIFPVWSLPASPCLRAMLPRRLLQAGENWPALLALARTTGSGAVRIECP